MATNKATFNFNSAISGINPENGKWNEEEHKKLVMPLRGVIMQIDGVTGVFIGRYAMTVDYLPGVVDLDTLKGLISGTMYWASTHKELFPLRGDKEPEAILERSRIQRVVVRFDSNLITCPVGESGGFDQNIFNEKTRGLVQKLVDSDGVMDCDLTLHDGVIVFNRDIVGPDTLIAHIEKVLTESTGEEIFPYIEFASNLDLEFSVHDN